MSYNPWLYVYSNPVAYTGDRGYSDLVGGGFENNFDPSLAKIWGLVDIQFSDILGNKNREIGATTRLFYSFFLAHYTEDLHMSDEWINSQEYYRKALSGYVNDESFSEDGRMKRIDSILVLTNTGIWAEDGSVLWSSRPGASQRRDL